MIKERRWKRLGMLAAALLAWSPIGFLSAAQVPAGYLEPLAPIFAARLLLPQHYREMALRHALVPRHEQQRNWRQPDYSDKNLTRSILLWWAYAPEGERFLAQSLDQESDPEVKQTIVSAFNKYLSRRGFMERPTPLLAAAIERRITEDPSPAVSLAALQTIESKNRFDLDHLVEERMGKAKAVADKEGLEQLREKHFLYDTGYVTLPRFAYRPPEVFSVAPARQTVRVLAFGDFGTGQPDQFKTAEAMRAYHRRMPFTFGITLGDNFYPAGLDDPQSPRWRSHWEELYGPLKIKFYPTFGNHDYSAPDSAAAELAYTGSSKTWVFPAPFYTYTAGAAQFFAIDTMRLMEWQLAWLDRELSKSKARWKIVYGHYQIYSASRGDEADLIERLLPVLKRNRVDLYLCGHDHNMQELKPEDGVHFFVVGSGGATIYNLRPDYPRSVFKGNEHGFGALDIAPARLTVSFIGLDGRTLHRREITKP